MAGYKDETGKWINGEPAVEADAGAQDGANYTQSWDNPLASYVSPYFQEHRRLGGTPPWQQAEQGWRTAAPYDRETHQQNVQLRYAQNDPINLMDRWEPDSGVKKIPPARVHRYTASDGTEYTCLGDGPCQSTPPPAIPGTPNYKFIDNVLQNKLGEIATTPGAPSTPSVSVYGLLSEAWRQYIRSRLVEKGKLK